MGTIGITLVLWIASAAASPTPTEDSRQATGVKVGEVTDTSAIVWMRLTAKPSRNADGIVRRGRPMGPLPDGVTVDDLEGSCPGATGAVRIRYGFKEDLSDARTTDWVEVKAENDFTHQFRLTSLKLASVYFYSAETAGPGGAPRHVPLRGQFETAPLADQRASVTFTVVTGQAYKDIDHPDGFHIYESMARLNPKFIVPTGDTVYYDSEDPRATTVVLARYHWHRMYGFPRHIAFHLRVPGYWEKDDHDTVSDDCWPTLKPQFMLPMTFEDGHGIFREQVPMGEKTYRTFRWGKALQVWLVEGRDFRSANNMPDGPEKTIWGDEQKRWLKESLVASDADWRVLISPTPIVGPDRPKGKNDNHSNVAFQHEGDEMRRWFRENLRGNFFIACGDRHWQYHSVHPETGLDEFSCGPASDPHAGGSPGEDPEYHKFHRVNGGFLSVSVRPAGDTSDIAFRFHDVHGEVVYESVRTQQDRNKAAGTTRLGAHAASFTINGKPIFLRGVSYYGALGAAEESIRRDLADMKRLGFNWIRVWATWAAFGNDVSAVDNEGKPRDPHLSKLQWLVAECDRQGIVVDVTPSRGNGTTGPARLQSLEAHRLAVKAVTTALKPYRNWYLDLANERNIRDKRFVSFDELKDLRSLARRLDADRLVTASHAGDIGRDDLREYLVTVGVDFVSPHRPRNPKSPDQTESKSREYLAWMHDLNRVVPLHYQEPFRRGFNPKQWEPPADAFVTDLKRAIAGGAAGWCFHNGDQKDKPDAQPRRSFDLRDARLFEQLDEQERAVLEAVRADHP